MHKVHPHGEGGSEGRKEKAKEGVNINIWEVRRAKKDGRWVRGKKGCEGLPGECIKSLRGKLPQGKREREKRRSFQVKFFPALKKPFFTNQRRLFFPPQNLASEAIDIPASGRVASSPDSGAVAKRRGAAAAAAKAAAGESEDDGGSLDITSVDSGGESGRRKKNAISSFPAWGKLIKGGRNENLVEQD